MDLLEVFKNVLKDSGYKFAVQSESKCYLVAVRF
jgi:hypothetical protein